MSKYVPVQGHSCNFFSRSPISLSRWVGLPQRSGLLFNDSALLLPQLLQMNHFRATRGGAGGPPHGLPSASGASAALFAGPPLGTACLTITSGNCVYHLSSNLSSSSPSKGKKIVSLFDGHWWKNRSPSRLLFHHDRLLRLSVIFFLPAIDFSQTWNQYKSLIKIEMAAKNFRATTPGKIDVQQRKIDEFREKRNLVTGQLQRFILTALPR